MTELKNREAKKMASSKSIIEAAIKVFGNKGYVLSTLNDVAKEANVSQGLVSQRFESKENLYKVCMETLCEPILVGIDGRSIEGVIQQVVAVCKMNVPGFKASQDFWMEFVSSDYIPQSVLDAFKEMLLKTRVLRNIQNAMDDGTIIKGDPYDRLMYFFRGVASIIQAYKKAGVDFPDDDVFYSLMFDSQKEMVIKNQIKETSSIHSSINKDFELIAGINLKESTVRFIHLSSLARNILDGQNLENLSATECKHILHKIIHPDDYRYYKDNCKIPIIINALKKEIAFYLNFRVLVNGKAMYIKAKFTFDDNNKDILIIGLVNIDDEMKSLNESAKVDKELAIRSAIEKVYEDIGYSPNAENANEKQLMSLYSIDIHKSQAKLIKVNYELDNKLVKNCSYEHYINDVVLNDALEEDIFKVKEFTSIDNIKASLKNTNKISLNYQRLVNNNIEYASIEINKGNDLNHIDISIFDISEMLKNRELIRQKLEEKEERDKGILKYLSAKYVALYYINLITKENRPYLINEKIKGDTSFLLSKYNTFEEQIEHFIPLSVYKDDQQGFVEFAKTFKEQLKDNRSISYIFRRKIGENYYYYKVEVTRLGKMDHELKRILVSFEDIDAQYREELLQKQHLEEARESAENANKAKTSFLFNMSHDIRTPMNAIIGFTQKAERNIGDPFVVKECLEKVQTSNMYLLNLINDVLDMARIESGKVSVEEASCNVAEQATGLVELFKNQANEKNIELVTNFEKVEHPYVYADVLRVTQVISNIMSNAIKYTKPGGKIIYSIHELAPKKEGYYSFELSIQDNGIGMSESYKEKIFDQFSRAENTTVSGIQGTGLGMAIVKKLVDMMGGSIKVDSELGVGTTVTVWFDFRKGDAKEITSVEDSAMVEGNSLDGCKILLVEDNELNREIACDILAEAGAIVESADDGSVAVKMVEGADENKYDIILMDIQMPYMNGYDATRLIRKMKTGIESVPIIAMTANAFDEDKKKAFEAGMDGHIAKPVDIQVLISTIQKFKK